MCRPKGQPLSESHKNNIRLAKKGKLMGNKSPAWKHGLSYTKKYKQEKRKEWKLNNKEKVYFSIKRRRAMKRNAQGNHTYVEWELLKLQYNWTCPSCSRKEPNIILTQDHIVPLQKGGCDDIGNIQPLCMRCNSKKNLKTIRYGVNICEQKIL